MGFGANASAVAISASVLASGIVAVVQPFFGLIALLCTATSFFGAAGYLTASKRQAEEDKRVSIPDDPEAAYQSLGDPPRSRKLQSPRRLSTTNLEREPLIGISQTRLNAARASISSTTRRMGGGSDTDMLGMPVGSDLEKGMIRGNLTPNRTRSDTSLSPKRVAGGSDVMDLFGFPVESDIQKGMIRGNLTPNRTRSDNSIGSDLGGPQLGFRSMAGDEDGVSMLVKSTKFPASSSETSSVTFGSEATAGSSKPASVGSTGSQTDLTNKGSATVLRKTSSGRSIGRGPNNKLSPKSSKTKRPFLFKKSPHVERILEIIRHSSVGQGPKECTCADGTESCKVHKCKKSSKKSEALQKNPVKKESKSKKCCDSGSEWCKKHKCEAMTDDSAMYEADSEDTGVKSRKGSKKKQSYPATNMAAATPDANDAVEEPVQKTIVNRAKVIDLKTKTSSGIMVFSNAEEPDSTKRQSPRNKIVSKPECVCPAPHPQPEITCSCHCDKCMCDSSNLQKPHKRRRSPDSSAENLNLTIALALPESVSILNSPDDNQMTRREKSSERPVPKKRDKRVQFEQSDDFGTIRAPFVARAAAGTHMHEGAVPISRRARLNLPSAKVAMNRRRMEESTPSYATSSSSESCSPVSGCPWFPSPSRGRTYGVSSPERRTTSPQKPFIPKDVVLASEEEMSSNPCNCTTTTDAVTSPVYASDPRKREQGVRSPKKDATKFPFATGQRSPDQTNTPKHLQDPYVAEVQLTSPKRHRSTKRYSAEILDYEAWVNLDSTPEDKFVINVSMSPDRTGGKMLAPATVSAGYESSNDSDRAAKTSDSLQALPSLSPDRFSSTDIIPSRGIICTPKGLGLTPDQLQQFDDGTRQQSHCECKSVSNSMRHKHVSWNDATVAERSSRSPRRSSSSHSGRRLRRRSSPSAQSVDSRISSDAANNFSVGNMKKMLNRQEMITPQDDREMPSTSTTPRPPSGTGRYDNFGGPGNRDFIVDRVEVVTNQPVHPFLKQDLQDLRKKWPELIRKGLTRQRATVVSEVSRSLAEVIKEMISSSAVQQPVEVNRDRLRELVSSNLKSRRDQLMGRTFRFMRNHVDMLQHHITEAVTRGEYLCGEVTCRKIRDELLHYIALQLEMDKMQTTLDLSAAVTRVLQKFESKLKDGGSQAVSATSSATSIGRFTLSGILKRDKPCKTSAGSDELNQILMGVLKDCLNADVGLCQSMLREVLDQHMNTIKSCCASGDRLVHRGRYSSRDLPSGTMATIEDHEQTQQIPARKIKSASDVSSTTQQKARFPWKGFLSSQTRKKRPGLESDTVLNYIRGDSPSSNEDCPSPKGPH